MLEPASKADAEPVASPQHMLRALSNINDGRDIARAEGAIRPALDGPATPVPAQAWFINQMRIVWAVLLLYVAGFLCFYPRGLTNFDEVSYVRQAVSLAAGSTTVDAVDPFTGQHQRLHPSDYPAGTSAADGSLRVAGWMARHVPAGTSGALGLHAVHGALDCRFGRLAAVRAGRARISARHGDGPHRHERPSERLPGGGRTVAVLGGRPKHSLAAPGRGFPGRRVHLPARAQSRALRDLLRGRRVPARAPYCRADCRRSGGGSVPAFDRRAGLRQSVFCQGSRLRILGPLRADRTW